MIGNIRNLAIGAGALGAVGVAGVGVYSTSHRDGASVENTTTEQVELCFKNGPGFWQGVEGNCLSREKLTALWDAPLVNNDKRAAVELSHPNGNSVDAKRCATCRQYKEMERDGWYAMTSRDIRNEAFFVRACSILALLEEARPARESHFADGSPSLEEMRALGPAALLRIAESGADKSIEARIEKTGAYEWRVSAGERETVIQEIVNADFNGDGAEDVLIFLYGTVSDGTAALSATAVLEKPAADAPVIISLLASGV